MLAQSGAASADQLIATISPARRTQGEKMLMVQLMQLMQDASIHASLLASNELALDHNRISPHTLESWKSGRDPLLKQRIPETRTTCHRCNRCLPAAGSSGWSPMHPVHHAPGAS